MTFYHNLCESKSVRILDNFDHLLSKSESVKFSLIESVILTDSNLESTESLLYNQLFLTDNQSLTGNWSLSRDWKARSQSLIKMIKTSDSDFESTFDAPQTELQVYSNQFAQF